jgi:prepilin-type N-terminal cleavage/methylation domain-containing protein
MLNLRKNKKGFTLLEILIVLVILAVLAGLAIPAYQSAVEKSRAQEALSGLAAARESCMRYFAVNNTYVGIPNNLATVVDYDPNVAVGGQTLIFSYAASNQAANTITITATRQGGPVGTISINQAGVVVRTGVYL